MSAVLKSQSTQSATGDFVVADLGLADWGRKEMKLAEAEMPVHEMAVSDAVMQMDLSDRPVVVFRNASHGEINVVYRRGDGNIGWIDPAGPLSSTSAAVAQQRTKKARKRG